MAVDIGIRIKADNMTGRDFDKLVGDLKRTGTTTEQVSRSAEGFENRLGTMRSQLQNVALGADAWTTAIGLAGKSFVAAGIEMEGITNGLTALEGSSAAAETQIASLRASTRQPIEMEGITDGLTALEGSSVAAETQIASLRASTRQPIEMEGITDGLTALEGSSAAAETQIASLRASTRQPIEMEGITKTAVQLKAVNLEADLANRTIREFGNALALVGLDETLLGVRQILSRGRVPQEELNQITERASLVPQVLQEDVEIDFDFEDIAARNRQARTTGVFGGVLVGEDEPHDVLDSAQDIVALTEGPRRNVQQLEIDLRAFSSVFKREFNETLLSGAKAYSNFVQSLRDEPRPDALLVESAIDALEAGQAGRDRRFEDELKKAAAVYQESDNRLIHQGQTYGNSLRGQQSFSFDRLSESTGNLVAAVPLDVVDAITRNVRVRQDGNAEILRLEQETAAEIQSIQESVTLSAEEKAREIERIERQSALRRVQIENEVSERQRASFQSVVTDFLSGIARMIAAEAQLALARRATSAISGLFSGGGAAVGGVGLLSGVILPLLGGLGLVFGASQLMGRSSPSADVYQRSHYGGAVSGSDEERSTPTVQPSRGQTRVGQEDGTRTLEANLNVTVEASGTRLGQANERVKLKTARWGG